MYNYNMKKLYIFGAGEFAFLAYQYFLEEGAYEFVGFVVDEEFISRKVHTETGMPIFVFKDVKDFMRRDDCAVFVAISASRMNTDRQNVYEKLKTLGCKFASYISPMAYVSRNARLGENVFVFEENVIQSGVTIGANSVLWSGNHIGHQTQVGSHVFFSSHVVVSGFCTIEDNCYFGVNSTIVDHIKVSHATLVGAASLILKETECNSVYVGSPAKKIEDKDPYSIIFR